MKKLLFSIALLFAITVAHAQCNTPNEVIAASVSGNSATITWNAVPEASSYTVRLITEANQPNFSDEDIIGTATTNSITFTNELEIGTTYYATVKAHCNNGQSSDWSPLNFSQFTTVSQNDLFTDAISLPVYSGVGAISDFERETNIKNASPSSTTLIGAESCFPNNNDIWFKFTATSDELMAIIQNEPNTNLVVNATVYKSDSGNLTFLSCYNSRENKIANLIPGDLYYLRIVRIWNNVLNADLNVKCYLAEIPSNDICVNAIALPIASTPSLDDENTLNGYIVGAQEQSTFAGGCGMLQNVFYKFTATNANHRLKLSENCFGLDVKLISGGCDAPVLISCAVNSTDIIFPGLTIGNEYLLSFGRVNPIDCINFEFKLNLTIAQVPANDLCENAEMIAITGPMEAAVPVFPQTGFATFTDFTTTCYPNLRDVWYKVNSEYLNLFVNCVAINTSILLSNYKIQFFSGTCTNLTEITCVQVGQNLPVTLPNTGIYYIRISTTSPLNTADILQLEIKYAATCQTAEQLCTSSSIEPYIFQNVTDTPGSGQMACLFTTPNPVYYFLKIGTAGDLNVQILQNSAFDQNGNPVGYNMDVDFVAWGPFDSPESCGAIVAGGCTPTPCPNNTVNPNFYPFNNIIDCSYSTSYLETLTINNAQEGQYYILLITNFNGLEGKIKLVQTNFGQAGAAQTECINRIQLIPYIDDNNNGVKDVEENTFNGGKFHIVKNNVLPGFDVQSSLGLYGLFPSEETDSYVITYEVLEEFSDYAFTPSASQTVTASSGVQSLFFPVTFTQQVGNVAITALQDAEARAGLSYTQKLIVTNFGTQLANTTLTFTKDPVTTLQNLDAGAQVTDTGFTYPINNLAVGSYKIINFKVAVPNIPIVSLDQILNAQATVSVVNNETAVANNTASIGTTVIAAYDPNNKLEQRGGRINVAEFDDSSYLVYTINFQNLGNASAIDVRIEDFLNDRLDPNSVEMIASSHYYYLTIENNKLVWEFPNIQLPAASTNENLSKGYVTFRVKLNSSEVVNETIPNGAAIYFDTNPPIFTNTHETVFFEVLSIDEQIRNTLKIYPNPVTNEINIKNINANEPLENISIYSTTGQLILDKNNATNTTTVDLSTISAGFYFIKVRMASGSSYTVKIVKH